jgi:hypothetical protein
MVPDYWVKVERSFTDRNTVILIGSAGGTYVPSGGRIDAENKWETPAAWVAQIEGGKVAEWRVYSDNEPIREKMRKRTKGNTTAAEVS